MKVADSKSLFAALFLLGSATPVCAAEVSLSCGSVGQEMEVCKAGAEAWAKKTGNTVKVVSTPTSSSERLALYQQILAAGAADIDVYQIDVIWPGILANHFVDLSKAFDASVIDSYFPAMIANNTVGGKLVAIPWFTDAGLMYYRKDLLEKYGEKTPETWEDLSRIAQKVQDAERQAGNDKMWGFVWQGRAYEGLTCDALEWVDSYGGGAIVDADGKVTINNPKAVQALTMAASWIGKISPDGVLNYQEEEARGVFQAGNAVFMRNWPYAWPLLNGGDSPVKDKVEVIAIPKGGADGKSTGTLGGWQLAVSKYSKNPEVAIDLVKYLTGPEEQKRRAIVGGYNPTIKALFKDNEVLAAQPFLGKLYDTFANAVARPGKVTGAKYNQVSSEFWNAAHRVLAGQATAEASLKELEQKLQRIGRNGKW